MDRVSSISMFGFACLAVVSFVLLFGGGCEKRSAPPGGGATADTQEEQSTDSGDNKGSVENATETDAEAESESVGVSREDVKREVSEAVETTGGYLSQKKDELVAAAKAKLAELDAEADQLKEKFAAKKEALSADAKVKWQAALEKLDEKKAAAAEKWAELNDEHSETVKTTFAQKLQDARGLLGRLKAKFKGESPQPLEEDDLPTEEPGNE